MYKVYCYNKCSTCQKALKFLNENNIKYELIDIKESNPNRKILEEIHLKSKKELKKLFNTSGLLYKEYELSKKIPNMTEDEMYELLSSNGMLVKRPILMGDDFSLIGFKEDEWKKLK